MIVIRDSGSNSLLRFFRDINLSIGRLHGYHSCFFCAQGSQNRVSQADAVIQRMNIVHNQTVVRAHPIQKGQLKEDSHCLLALCLIQTETHRG